eukprot:TRINITY_DN27148_c0_g1_i1.p2 TRINITY_DN27148_c0_g1~~TRINITY_DN27148_c0_g1_i1.p2  ORF type:complete len:120 (+),score=2.84 TRINITY_DN27148_c0_g1_i1:155-514(+)
MSRAQTRFAKQREQREMVFNAYMINRELRKMDEGCSPVVFFKLCDFLLPKDRQAQRPPQPRPRGFAKCMEPIRVFLRVFFGLQRQRTPSLSQPRVGAYAECAEPVVVFLRRICGGCCLS